MNSIFRTPPRGREYHRYIDDPYRVRLMMTDFPAESGDKEEMAAVIKNLGRQQVSSGTVSSQQQQQQHLLTNTTSSTSRVAKTSHSSQRMHVSEMKSDLSELKSSISEMRNLSNSTFRMRSSLEDLDRSDIESDNCDLKSEPLVTFPDPDTPPPVTGTVSLSSPNLVSNITPNSLIPNGVGHVNANHLISSTSTSTSTTETVKIEQKRMTSASKTKLVTDSFGNDQVNGSEVKRVQTSDISYQEQLAASAVRSTVEIEGVSADKTMALKQNRGRLVMTGPFWRVALVKCLNGEPAEIMRNGEFLLLSVGKRKYGKSDHRSLTVGEISQQESQNMTATSMKLQKEEFSSEKKAISQQQQRVLATGIYNQGKHMEQSSQSNYTITSKSVISSAQMHSLTNGGSLKSEEDPISQGFEDLEGLNSCSSQQDVDKAIKKYSTALQSFIQSLQCNNFTGKGTMILDRMNQMIQRAWEVPTYGHELGNSLCNVLRKYGGLDILISNCVATDKELQFASARLLEQCLTTENRAHVVEYGLDKVVNVACVCTKNANNEHSRVGTGILEHLFKHSEGTCSDVIRLGGLDAVLFECRKNDVETLRHCASALANLSLYGGAENQEAMIKRKVPMWLFPLAFHNDDNIKYYACLAIAVLVANKEIEAAVLKSGTLDLVEPFVTSHNPSEFAKSNLSHAHGLSKHWLQRLVPVLSSKREEARNLATFHFCMEAGIKKQQGNTDIFREIGAIEPLKKCASCPNAVASKYAAQALRLMGEEVPHKLSQQVPLWSTEDVKEWVKQIGFAEYAGNFAESRVDGDLLLQLTEENLRDDIEISNGIRRRRFARELQNLKKMADYSSRDTSNLNSFLQSIGPEFSIYTYSMLNAGVDRDTLRNLKEEQLMTECGISNSIHRLRILDTIKVLEDNIVNSSEENLDKSLDVFVSYRRSNGSQLASLLKVHLQLRGFTVFIDVERLEAGKFDNNLLQSIRQAKFFLLVLTPNALERCVRDNEGKDWVHREIVAALQSQCNIIPIIDNFQWPEPEELPEDMRAVCHFNGVRWIHDYQDACVDKLERFMRGELVTNSSRMGLNKGDVTPGTPCSISRQPPSYQRMHSNDSTGKGSDKDGNGSLGGSKD